MLGGLLAELVAFGVTLSRGLPGPTFKLAGYSTILVTVNGSEFVPLGSELVLFPVNQFRKDLALLSGEVPSAGF